MVRKRLEQLSLSVPVSSCLQPQKAKDRVKRTDSVQESLFGKTPASEW